MQISDNDLIRQVKTGDTEAFSLLVERYQKPVFNLMYRMSYSQNDAAELTQDIFCRCFEKLADFQNTRNFFPWLYTLAMNHGKDWLRKQERSRNGLFLYENESGYHSPPTIPESLEKKQEVDNMQRALSTLSMEKRELLILRYNNDLTIVELGEIFNLSDSAVKMRIHRSLATLHKILLEET
jgi:RNA polymerase sigma-70 factor (ECF subfamily)